MKSYRLIRTMNTQKLPTTLFCLAITCLVFCFAQDALVSDKRFCGYQHTDDYVRAGNETYIDEFPWTAALIYKFITDGTKALLCSGSLINNRYVLTAAQCLTHPKATVLVGVRLGEYNIKNETDCVGIRLIADQFDKICTNVVDYGIEEKVVHAEYDHRTRVNDIALLRLSSIVEYSDYIRPICIFSGGPTSAKVNDKVEVSGWGRLIYGGETAEFKKKIPVTVISNEECAREFPKRTITTNQICTRDLEDNKEFICQGDAGGPVMFAVGGLRQWQLEGIASWSGRCGSGRPAVHTKVSSFIEWIRANMRLEKD